MQKKRLYNKRMNLASKFKVQFSKHQLAQTSYTTACL